MDDIAKLKGQIIATIVEREGGLLAIQDAVQKIIDDSVAALNKGTKELEGRYAGTEDASADDFMRELRLLEEKLKSETQVKLDALLRDVSDGQFDTTVSQQVSA